MRNHLINELVRLAKTDKRIFLITGDLGFGVLEDFEKENPNQYINAGIAEQNMASVAAGVALEGNIVYTYSIGNFPLMRCLEQVRNDICYHNANVKIVAVAGGFPYGQLGMSHQATEDLAIARALPNMTVFSPADPDEAVEVLKAANKIDGPCYIRLGKNGEPKIHPTLKNYDVMKLMKMTVGERVAVITTGSVISEAFDAVKELSVQGINVSLYNCIAIKPIDSETIKEIAEKHDFIITLEEHNIIGGLGGAVAEMISELYGKHAALKRLGLQDMYTSVVGSQNYLRKVYGVSKEKIIETVMNFYNK